MERTLRRGRRLGALGWLSAIFGLAQVIVAVASAEIWNLDFSEVADQWYLWSAVAFFVLAGVLLNWTRFWVRESRSPFRYTFSIEPFQPVPDDTIDRDLLHWLERDLEETLSRRIPRLSRLVPGAEPQAAGPDESASEPAPRRDASHIHIAANYGVRRRKDERTFFEVTPWIRMGPPGNPSTLAHPVRFRLREAKSPDADEDAYESVIERIYFSVATAIYARIEKDVEEKIDLLPGSRFRAAAYFYEAEDYVRSNTLDAYDKAGALYRSVIEIYDPEWRPAAGGSLDRSRQSVRRVRARVMRRVRRWGAKALPRLAAVQLTAARAHLGYANTLLYRRILASLSGQRINPVFETKRGTERAIQILEALPEYVPGRREVLFNAYVTHALAATQLHSGIEAQGWLREAQALDPARAERNARCLFVRGLVQPQLRPRAQLLRQAAEADPDFEVAQFELAKTVEMVWRTRPTFEPNVAKTVLDEYDRVLSVNPGNVVAWGNAGYIHWLLKEFDKARDAYERGRQYKEIKRETFVAQLDYGLARIAAEGQEPRFADAYRHYLNGVTADIASGVSHDPGYSDYQFERIGGEMMARFESYLETVRGRASREDQSTSKRERESVLAFVLNDYGEACVNYYHRFGDPGYLDKGLAAFDEAGRLSPGFLLPYYNIHRFRWKQDDLRPEIGKQTPIERVCEREPNWPDALLELVTEDADRVPILRVDAARLRDAAEEAEAESVRKRAEALRLAAAGLKPGVHDSVGALQVPQPQGQAALTRVVAEQAREAERRRGPAGGDPMKLQDAAVDLEARAISLRGDADEADGDAGRRQQEITELFDRLLPQRWLWSAEERQRSRSWLGPMGRLLPGGQATRSVNGSSPAISLTALGRKDYKRDLRWERELDEVHVRALLAWCNTPTAKPAAAESVLRHILERYWPGDFDVLREYRRRLLARQSEGEQADNLKEVHARLVEIIDGWLEGDPDFWKLTWLIEEDPEIPDEQRIFTVDEASGRLNTASKRHEERVGEALRRDREAGNPDYVHLWVGLQLDELGRDSKEVLEVYRRAARSKRPGLQAAVGERFAVHRSWEESAEAFRLAASDAPHDAARKWAVRGAARALFALDQHSEAIQAIQALAADVEEDGHWRTDLVTGLADEVVTPPAYAALAEWLETGFESDGRVAASDAASALIELAGSRYDEVVRAPEAHRADARRELPAGATPLLLETDPAFFPDGENTPELEPMLAAIERARAEIEAATGVTIPGVRIRVDPALGDGRYVVLLREAPIATGRIDPSDRRFRRPMVRHLRRTVLDHLGDLAGFQDMEARLATWELEHANGLAPWAERILDDDRKRARLVQVVQALARERVSVHDLTPIIEACARVDPESPLQDAVESVRAQLPPETLGVREEDNVVALPGDLEAAVADGVQERGEKRFLAMPTLEADELLSAFREFLAELDAPVLVVRDPQLRPFARRVVEREHPSVPILARSELGGPRWRRRLRTVRP